MPLEQSRTIDDHAPPVPSFQSDAGFHALYYERIGSRERFTFLSPAKRSCRYLIHTLGHLLSPHGEFVWVMITLVPTRLGFSNMYWELLFI